MSSPHGATLVHAGAGVLATVVGLAAGHLVAAVTNSASSPVLAVGSTVIDLTPTPVKEWAIAQFGTADKPILIGSVLLGTLALAALAGVLAQRHPTLGAGLLLVLVTVAGAAAVLRPAATPLDVLPAAAAAAVAIAALLWLAHALAPATSTPQAPAQGPRERGWAWPPRSDEGAKGVDASAAPTPGPAPAQASSEAAGTGGPPPGTTRRTILISTGLIATAAVVMGSAGQWIGTVRTRIGDIVLPKAANPLDPLPTGLEAAHPGISSFQTPNEEFYRVDTNLTVPVVDIPGWSLTIDGDVDNELILSFDDLAVMPLVERDITLTCVSNEVGGTYVGAARWLGVPLADLMERAGVGSTADQILSTAVDGFTISTPLDVALDGRDTMIAIGMNGEPLPRAHGFPARLVTPGIYGFVGATKWLTRLTLTTYATREAYWTERDWATDAPIKISSRVDTPRPLSTVDAGTQVIGGVAWAQDRGIGKVEVRVDGGRWQEAELGPDAGVDYWRQWFLPWDATTGRHMIAVRATDLDGEVQTAARTTPFPAGSSGVQEIVVSVR